jgi:hypothetical protein
MSVMAMFYSYLNQTIRSTLPLRSFHRGYGVSFHTVP